MGILENLVAIVRKRHGRGTPGQSERHDTVPGAEKPIKYEDREYVA
jgi:hypothetical protein